ncbi:MarR family winged helix-turn-helix transcriptional regulator [Propionibacterium sp. oral taxon 192]|uniref:MarR family winged helix-turn-helix transcriptional regulator n=1 Tax=Propionibacterium sp. oral taxon 192 TaxID=671222 RepID=UPI000565B611|nr:MarR family winged helix-turn-helix transcriptional regulator [Propionibacterium sp. oral taxon 192]
MTHNDSVEVIRAWWRLERARARFDAHLKQETGVTGSQLALLRIIDEHAPVSIRQLRDDLDWHPASLGQAIQRLENRGLVTVTNDPTDRRRRICHLTQAGGELLTRTPLVGPVRLRTQPIDPDDLATMQRGFDLALTAFGFDEWSHDE